MFSLVVLVTVLVRLLGLVQGQGEPCIYLSFRLMHYGFSTSHFVFSTSGLSIEFMGVTSYANDTTINITEVGEGDNAVLCMTNLTPCCRNSQQGDWIYPDGTPVNGNRTGDDIYRDRRDMVVRLHRRNNVITPTGQYCCEVPTMANPSSNATICIILGKYRIAMYLFS